MKRFQVMIAPAAEIDIEGSYLWGCKHWGIAQAQQWLRELRGEIRSLATLPERHPSRLKLMPSLSRSANSSSDGTASFSVLSEERCSFFTFAALITNR